MTDKKVTVFGTSRAKPGDSVYDLAYRTGQAIAQAGFELVNGGYGGSMLASAKAASEIGASTIGITCSAFNRPNPNQYIKKEILTNSLDERLKKLIELGDAYAVLPGGTGTLLEFAMVWELKNKSFVNKNKPLILLGDFWTPLIDVIEKDDPGSKHVIEVAHQPEQLIDILKNYF